MSDATDIPQNRSLFQTVPSELFLMVARQLEEERQYGDGNENILNLSRVSKNFRNLLLPMMFRRVGLYCEEKDAHQKLACLLSNNHLLQIIQSLAIGTKGTHDEYDYFRNTTQTKICGPCHESVPAQLIAILSTTPNLVELRLRFHYGQKTIEPAFRKSAKRLQLPALKGLKLCSNGTTWMAGVCPNLERFSMTLDKAPRPTKGLLAFAGLRTLDAVEFEAHFKGWKESDIDKIVDMFPNVRHLFLKGELKARASSFAPIIARMHRLRFLALTVDPAVTGNSDLMDDRYLDEEDDLKQHSPLNEEREKVTGEFFRQCTSLEKLCLGEGLGSQTFVTVTDKAGSRTWGKVGDIDGKSRAVMKGGFLACDYFGWPRIAEVGSHR